MNICSSTSGMAQPLYSGKVKEFFEALFRDEHEGFINIWDKGKEVKTSYYFAPNDAELMNQAMRLDEKGGDVYYSVGVGEMRLNSYNRFKQEHIISLPAYFLDVDTLQDSEKAHSARFPEDIPHASDLLQGLEYPPSAMIGSGHGIHAYWFLEHPVPVKGYLGSVKTNLRTFADAVALTMGCPDLDAKASEPSRVLRVPGTRNHKENPPLPVEILFMDAERRYSAAELNEWAKGVMPVKSAQNDGKALQGKGVSVSPVSLDDKEIVELLCRDPERKSLWEGNLGNYSGDHSAADLALCNHLAFFTGCDARRMDDLFRASGLYRKKWNEKHGAQTYSEMTISKAIEGTTNVYTGARGDEEALIVTGVHSDFDDSEGPQAAKSSEPPQEAPTVPAETPDADRLQLVADAYRNESQGAYYVTFEPHLGIAGQRYFKNAPIPDPLADFIIDIEETIVRDDGANRYKSYLVSGWRYDGVRLPCVEIPEREFSQFNWVSREWRGAVVEPGSTKRDKLRCAVQKAERVTAKERCVYAHTGWRRIHGKWVFLHAGGGVGADNSVNVELEGELKRYCLPDGNPTAEDVRTELKLLELAPMTVTIPLLATVYAAPLQEFFIQGGEPLSHVLMLKGATGAGKSTLAALFLEHFGDFTSQTLPCNFESTANAIRKNLFVLKDVPVVIDDFHPTGTNRDRMTATAQDISRAFGDHAARQRMRADGVTKQADMPARGVGIMTAEFVPGIGESGTARLFVCELQKDAVNWPMMTTAQTAGAEGVYARVMRGFILWIGERVNTDSETFEADLIKQVRQLRDEINKTEEKIHPRLATAAAFLLVSLEQMFSFFKSLTDENYRPLYAEAREAILQDVRLHAETVSANDPLRIFAHYLEEASSDSNVLPVVGTLEVHDNIGWYSGKENGDVYYLKPGATYKALAIHERLSGEAFPISKSELWKRLHERGFIASEKAEPRRISGDVSTSFIEINGDALQALIEGAD